MYTKSQKRNLNKFIKHYIFCSLAYTIPRSKKIYIMEKKKSPEFHSKSETFKDYRFVTHCEIFLAFIWFIFHNFGLQLQKTPKIVFQEIRIV